MMSGDEGEGGVRAPLLGQGHALDDRLDGSAETFSMGKFQAMEREGLPFEKVNGYSWEMVVVLPAEAADRNNIFIQRFRERGLETQTHPSILGDKLFVLLRCSVVRYAYWAASTRLKLLLNADRVKAACERGLPHRNIKPILINHEPDLVEYEPHQLIFAPFTLDPEVVELFECGPEGHPFSTNQRLKMMLEIFEMKLQVEGTTKVQGISMRRKVASRWITAYYPLHDDIKRKELAKEWFGKFHTPWEFEGLLDKLRDYFGEKVGLYFCFFTHYTLWLSPLAVAGVVVGIDMIAENTMNAVLVPFYCLVVSVWTIVMLEYWKRRESTRALHWGMAGFEDSERDRPEFRGKSIRSLVTGENATFYPPNKRNSKLAQSQVIIAFAVMLVVAAVVAIVFLRIYMTQTRDDDSVNQTGQIIPPLINAVQIQVLNYLYTSVAEALNKRENHRTDTEYEDALIAKLVGFQFVNSFASLYYTAFIKISIEPSCDNGGCTVELAYSLGTIFIVRVVTTNLNTLLMPVFQRWQYRKFAKLSQEGVVSKDDEEQAILLGIFAPIDSCSKIPACEQEFLLNEYHEMMGTLQEFASLSVQFGYVTLFVAAFPWAPLLAFASNFFELKMAAVRLLYFQRKPHPRSAEDIGSWLFVFALLAILAVITNTALVCFNLDTFNVSDTAVVWVFVCIQYALFIFQGALSFFIPDVPYAVDVQLRRREYIVSKLVDRVEDDHNLVVTAEVEQGVPEDDGEDEA